VQAKSQYHFNLFVFYLSVLFVFYLYFILFYKETNAVLGKSVLAALAQAMPSIIYFIIDFLFTEVVH